ncbi:MAG: DotU family type IV/VI secretion system protein [Phycisphaeraceae bacterium]|nr:DotU family type IV/VI secretion system protein [Phycisphaeraceae bacterium]
MEQRMTLVDICEPVFQYVCRLNRLSRKGGRQDWGLIRGEIVAIVSEVKSKAESAGYASVWDRADLVLTYFIDSMILSSRIGQQGGWKPLSHERGKLGFEEEFWELLEDALKDPSDQATQLLGVFYVCIGLGFTGYYTGQPDYIKRKQLEVSSRLRGMVDADMAARICPDAYENVDTRNLTQPPNRSLAGLAILAVGLLIVVLVSYVFFFKHASQELDKSLGGVRQGWEQGKEKRGG